MLKVVIPAAGLGTRLLSATKEQPKEMLPVFAQDSKGARCLKPLVQLIFEQLFMLGAREFCFIVGREKRVMEDQFTPDEAYVSGLRQRGKKREAEELSKFYKKIRASKIVWVNQSEPQGFGHAVLQSEPFTADESFLVHAGDTYIVSKPPFAVEKMIHAHARAGSEVTMLLREMRDPRQYGVAEITKREKELTVLRVVEKPLRPRSKFAILPLYVFNPSIYDALKHTSPDKRKELQLTNAIQRLIDRRCEVRAIKLRRDEIRLDIGTPETYWEALGLSYHLRVH
jgi:UTP--glucose-1-phosphate uridylyltransferase